MANEMYYKNGAPAGGEQPVLTTTYSQDQVALNTTVTGWADYADGQYTSGSPFSLAANTDTALPNNAATIIDSQKPADVTTFYDGSVITGRDGDGLLINLDFKVVPQSGAATYIETWIDIGGAVGELYRCPASFPKGAGEVRSITQSTAAYTLNTWEANGGTVYVRSNGPCEIYDIRYVLFRTHKAL